MIAALLIADLMLNVGAVWRCPIGTEPGYLGREVYRMGGDPSYADVRDVYGCLPIPGWPEEGETAEHCPGDVNGDGVVGIPDLLLVQMHMNKRYDRECVEVDQ